MYIFPWLEQKIHFTTLTDRCYFFWVGSVASGVPILGMLNAWVGSDPRRVVERNLEGEGSGIVFCVVGVILAGVSNFPCLSCGIRARGSCRRRRRRGRARRAVEATTFCRELLLGVWRNLFIVFYKNNYKKYNCLHSKLGYTRPKSLWRSSLASKRASRCWRRDE